MIPAYQAILEKYKGAESCHTAQIEKLKKNYDTQQS